MERMQAVKSKFGYGFDLDFNWETLTLTLFETLTGKVNIGQDLLYKLNL